MDMSAQGKFIKMESWGTSLVVQQSRLHSSSVSGRGSVPGYCCSVTQLCPTLWDPMDCSTPGFPVLHHLRELAQTHVHWIGNAMSSVASFSCIQSFPESGSFLMSQLFVSGGQSIGASASASVLPVNIQDWFSLGLTGCSPCSTRLSRDFPTPQFKITNSSALSLLFGPTLTCISWLLEKP